MNRIIPIVLVVFLTACSSGKEEYEKGLQYLKEGKTDLAQESFSKAVAKNPDRASCYVNIARLYLEKGWLEGAESNARQAVDVLEFNRQTVTGIPYEKVLAEAYTILGEVEVEKSNQSQMSLELKTLSDQFATAVGHFKKACQLDPANVKAEALLKKYGRVM